MKKVSRLIDKNAHIDNVTCSVTANTNNTLNISISFDNLGYGAITAIKFNATGYNSFGDIISVNGNQQFFLVIQDIKIEKNERAENLRARIENSEIRRIELEEYQVCFADGSVVSYNGKSEISVETEEFESYGSEGELLSALREVVSPRIKYTPRDLDNGWFCSCGRYNKTDDSKCTLCGLDKSTVFKIGSSDFHEEVKKQNDLLQEALITKQKAEESQKKKKSVIRGLIIIVAIIVGIFIVASIINSAKLSDRRTYSSVDSMKEAVKGRYTYYTGYSSYTKEAKQQIIISDDVVTYVYGSSSLMNVDLDIKEWDYANGVIRGSAFKDLIVTKSGDIQEKDGKLYEKGGPTKLESSSSSQKTESGYTALKITIDSVTSNTGYCICTGSVKNTGSNSYKFVTVKGAFKDADGNVIDTDSTYAVGSEGLAPGESSTFRLSVTKNSKIKSCSVTLLDFD